MLKSKWRLSSRKSTLTLALLYSGPTAGVGHKMREELVTAQRDSYWSRQEKKTWKVGMLITTIAPCRFTGKYTTEQNIQQLSHTCLTWQSVPFGQSGTILLHLFSDACGSRPRFSLTSDLLPLLLLFLGGRVSGGLRVTRIFGSWTTSRFWPDTRIILPPLQEEKKMVVVYLSHINNLFWAFSTFGKFGLVVAKVSGSQRNQILWIFCSIFFLLPPTASQLFVIPFLPHQSEKCSVNNMYYYTVYSLTVDEIGHF